MQSEYNNTVNWIIRPNRRLTVVSHSHGAIFDDLERPLTEISSLHHYLRRNISETATKGTAIIAIECKQETVTKLSNGTIFNDPV